MADTETSHEPNAPINRPGNSWRLWIVGEIKRNIQERNARKEQENAADKAARITASATKWMAFFTFLLFLVTGGTLIVLKLQLAEMHSGGEDTHNLAVAAGSQARQARLQSSSTKKLAEAAKAESDQMAESVARTDSLIAATDALAIQSRRTADYARQSLEAVRGNFGMDQRAWVKATPVKFPLTIGNDAVISAWPVTVTNVGKNPTVNARVLAQFEVVPKSSAPSLSFSTRRIEVQIGFLFPGDPDTFPIYMLGPNGQTRLSAQEIDDLQKGRSYLAVFGQMIYGDQFGRHWTQFCAWQGFATGAFNSRSCVQWNAVGEGDPPAH